MKKKAFALLLSLGLIFSLTTFTVFAGGTSGSKSSEKAGYEVLQTSVSFQSEGAVDHMLPDSKQRIEKAATLNNVAQTETVEVHHSIIDVLLLIIPSFAALFILFLFDLRRE